MLKRIWQWLKRLFQQILGKRTSPQPSPLEGREQDLLVDDAACENLFMQLLDGVHQGWSRGQVKGFLLSKSLNEGALVAWLQEFGIKLLESPEPDQELLRRMVRLGELDCGEISKVSYNIGIQRLIKEAKPQVWEYDGPDE
jgi:hypothetical protein